MTLNQATETNGDAKQVQSVFDCIATELAEVDRRLRAELSSSDEFVNEMLAHAAQMGGKRLRPALLLLVAKSLGEINQQHLTLSVVIEMIHAATLIHDDVLDGAEQRRHLPTHRSIWGNESSVLVGDFLFSRAFHLASLLETTHACREIGNATNTVCEGEMRQIGSCSNFHLTEQEYIEIIESKTAALCATASYLGACYSETVSQPDAMQTENFREYGRLLGIAFQIVDDVLDIDGNEAKVGKSLGTDLQQHKPTLPLIHLLSAVTPTEKKTLIESIQANQADISKRLTDLMHEHGSIDYAMEKAAQYAKEAGSRVEFLKSSESASALQQIPNFVVMRRH